MSFYDDRVLPHIVNVVMNTKQTRQIRARVCAELSGEVLEINTKLDAEPALVNTSPYGDGWMVKVRMTTPSETAGLLDAAAYSSKLG